MSFIEMFQNYTAESILTVLISMLFGAGIYWGLTVKIPFLKK